MCILHSQLTLARNRNYPTLESLPDFSPLPMNNSQRPTNIYIPFTKFPMNSSKRLTNIYLHKVTMNNSQRLTNIYSSQSSHIFLTLAFCKYKLLYEVNDNGPLLHIYKIFVEKNKHEIDDLSLNFLFLNSVIKLLHTFNCLKSHTIKLIYH